MPIQSAYTYMKDFEKMKALSLFEENRAKLCHIQIFPFFIRYSFGVIPCFFLKDLLKYEILLKPQSNAISIILSLP